MDTKAGLSHFINDLIALDNGKRQLPCGCALPKHHIESRFSRDACKEELKCEKCHFQLFKPSSATPLKWCQFPIQLGSDGLCVDREALIKILPRIDPSIAHAEHRKCDFCNQRFGLKKHLCGGHGKVEEIVKLPCDHLLGISCLEWRLDPDNSEMCDYCPKCEFRLFLRSPSEPPPPVQAPRTVAQVITLTDFLWALESPEVSQIDEEDRACSMCYEPYDGPPRTEFRLSRATPISDGISGNWPVKLVCSHIFCFECLETWLLEASSCPKCRFTLFQTRVSQGFVAGISDDEDNSDDGGDNGGSFNEQNHNEGGDDRLTDNQAEGNEMNDSEEAGNEVQLTSEGEDLNTPGATLEEQTQENDSRGESPTARVDSAMILAEHVQTVLDGHESDYDASVDTWLRRLKAVRKWREAEQTPMIERITAFYGEDPSTLTRNTSYSNQWPAAEASYSSALSWSVVDYTNRIMLMQRHGATSEDIDGYLEDVRRLRPHLIERAGPVVDRRR